MTMTSGERWAVVLAGGEGERMADWVERRLGERRPKQYCAFTGTRTMLEHTWERAAAAVGRGRVVTVIGRSHERFLYMPRPLAAPGPVLIQPQKRDTAAGVLFPLAYILSQDPEATVAILPSDHFILPNDRFLDCLRTALDLADVFLDRLVLLAAQPTRPETDYGWIEPSGHVLRGGEPAARTVSRFLEKPDEEEARRFYQAGRLWNTMITAARGRGLWAMAQGLVPALTARFDRLRAAMGEPEEGRVLEEIYRDMPAMNFSRHILERAATRTLAVPMRGVYWCDWGRPERLAETVKTLGLAPALSLEEPAPSQAQPA